MAKHKSEGGVETITRDDTKVRKPKLYKVLLINDDYTTMDFVVSVLESIFNKAPAEALQIMLHVHQRGQGLCGVYPREIAEAKVHQVHERARAEGHPLRCHMDEE